MPNVNITYDEMQQAAVKLETGESDMNASLPTLCKAGL